MSSSDKFSSNELSNDTHVCSNTEDKKCALLKRIEQLEYDLAQARETNQRLNRRVSAIESPWQKDRDRNEAEKIVWREAWNKEFERVGNSFKVMKEIYELCAPVLNIPYGMYHSVNDCSFAKPNEKYTVKVAIIHANKVLPAIDIVDVVKSVVDRVWADKNRDC